MGKETKDCGRGPSATNYLTVPSGSYNAASLPTTINYGSGVQATIGYNARFQLGALDYKLGSTDMLNLTYNYNQTVGGNTVNNGQIQAITDTRGNAFSTGYTYDALGRLAQGQTLDLTSANTWKLGWVYDRYGNRSQQNLLGGTISTTAPQLVIDPTTNRITTAGYSYDAAGNLQADGLGNTYTYNAENRTTAVSGATPASYSYDGNGLRVKKVVGSTTTNYIFSGSKVVAEYANGTLSSRYVYAGGQLLATIASGTASYHYPDQLSSRVETNATGTVTRTFGHLPFGETWYETGTAIKSKFTSYERDSESGLDYATFRYDSSRLGRFMTADPLAGSTPYPQSLNRYGYVLNDPVNLVDPLGLCDPWTICVDVWAPLPSDPFSGGGGHPSPVLDVDPARGPTGKVLKKLLRIFASPDCIRFLQSVIQQATLLAAQQADASKLDSGGQDLFNTNPYSVLTQVMNAQLMNQPGQNPQQGGVNTWAQAGPFDFPKTITLYAGYFGASTTVQAQTLTHEGTHLIYPFSDTQLAAAAGVPGNSSQQSSSNYQHELEKHCK